MVRRSPRRSRLALAAVALAVLAAACSGGGSGRPDALEDEGDGPNRGSLPTIPGGVELARTETVRALAGVELAFGAPLPSEQLAADGFREDPEVVEVTARRVYATTGARHLADLLVLRIDGTQVFDLDALHEFEQAAVASLAGLRTEPETVTLAGTEVTQAMGEPVRALGYLTGDLLVLLRGPRLADLTFVATRQLEAIARGDAGSAALTTPLPPTPPAAAFITVPNVSFAPIPPPEEEPAGPEPPQLNGVTGVDGRYGVVAGERRTVAWVLTLDPAVYPSAETLDAALPEFVSARAGGAPAELSEVIDRVVLSATSEPGGPSARAFRHLGVLVLVEADRPDQLDAVVTAWIAALAGV